MKKYRIAIEETLRKVVEIEAETPGLAVCRAEDEYNEEKHVLSADNFAGADIALSTDDSTVMETLEDVDFIGYVQRRFEECRESISVEDKVRLAFGSFDNALASSANTVRRRPGTARRSTCCTGAMPGTTVLPWSS
ncbi:DpnD/PcfM family protein [Bacteroides uniformis]|nr:DpnD/PcfM family protein [Bacteroides uniformis]